MRCDIADGCSEGRLKLLVWLTRGASCCSACTPQGESAAEGPAAQRRRQLRSALGAALFVAAVEAAWQAQRRVLRPLPAAARRAAAPLQLGLRAARVAVWSAGLLLVAAQTRASCFAAGDSILGALETTAAATAERLPAWAHTLLLSRWGQAPEGKPPLLPLKPRQTQGKAEAASCGAWAEVAQVEDEAAPGAPCSTA